MTPGAAAYSTNLRREISGLAQRHPPRPVLDTGDDQGQFVAVNASLAGPVGIGLP